MFEKMFVAKKTRRSAKNTQMEAVYDVSTTESKTQLFRDFSPKKIKHSLFLVSQVMHLPNYL